MVQKEGMNTMRFVMLTALASLPVLAAETAPAPIPVNLKVGQQATVLLNGNPTTGYVWKLASKVNHFIVSAELTCPAQENNGFCCGFPTPTTLTLTALIPGRTLVRVCYARPWEKHKPAADIRTFDVTVSPADK